jgi:hypothetical protein
MSDDIFDGDDEILDLAALAGEVSRRGRKSEVDPALVSKFSSLAPGKGFFYPGSDQSGAAYQAYLAEKGKPRSKDDGSLESRDEAMRRATNAWQQRYRQRAVAVAQAAGVENPYIRWHDSGRLLIGRPAA